jgi:hypothetical protein
LRSLANQMTGRVPSALLIRQLYVVGLLWGRTGADMVGQLVEYAPQRTIKRFLLSVNLGASGRPGGSPSAIQPCEREVARLLLQPWVQRVAQAITEHVERQDGDENRHPWENSDPGVILDEHHIGAQIPAPTRGRGLRAQSQEA